MAMQSHIPQGDPCAKCGSPARRHRVDHSQDGDPCKKCGGISGAVHRERKRELSEHVPKGNPCEKCGLSPQRHKVYHSQDGDPCKKCGGLSGAIHVDNREHDERIYVGIDGEGQGRNPHRYVLLAAADESGERRWHVENADGLSTVDCLDFIVSLPNRTRIFSYAFNYDLTKMLVDMPDQKLYRLFRPELRQRKGEAAKHGPRPVVWNGYRLNLQGTKFTVSKGNRTRVIWDVFRFFQSKFVNALADWKVGSKETLERMADMKNRRSDFDQESFDRIREYCFDECRCLAELAHRLTDAHEEAGLKLTAYYGAGSTGAAMLRSMGIDERVVKPIPEMLEAVAASFFGGRFEINAVGRIEGTVYNYDISSAYPYELFFLPCLQHGEWRQTYVYEEMRAATAALVSYRIPPRQGEEFEPWAPLPFREKDGSICFPSSSSGGWIWREEFIAAEEAFPHVEFLGAWIYESACDCRPFQNIPHFYLERLKLGKEAKGLVLKLGMNSCYGKLAQSVGSAPLNCWIWAAMITSGTRAQILRAMALHKDRRNLLMVATDGIFTKERLFLPPPKDTGTSHTSKPLGGWEEKIGERGVFIARPGIYFPLNPSEEDIKQVRARGIGKAELLKNWQKIIDAWDSGQKSAHVSELVRFCGAKTSIHKNALGYNRAEYYGQWIQRPIMLSFNPMPKRSAVLEDGTLTLRSMPDGLRSKPYDRTLSPLAAAVKAAELESSEQPDGFDLSEVQQDD